ncbi:MAG: RagB/SusD family nutrient uptake outer membrane protein, partial [Bacteroidetes bacterium]|nr:RagB/SusD family nutrient uptake outer membrane protein [Bacteroidota bacterium]
DKSNTVSDSTAKLLKGESRFLRAFCYFQLVNLYNTPPLVNTTEVSISAYAPNSTRADLYAFIISDLKEAYNLLTPTYPAADRVRANKSAVSALLANAYLFTKDWVNAETEATRQITNTAYSLPADLSTVFIKSSTETIWQLWSSLGYNNTQGANYIPGSTSSVLYTLRPGLLNAFETGDARKTAWVKQGTGASASLYYPYKYKQRSTPATNATEYVVQFRLAEQYLIRAEARAWQNNIPGGLADLNVIRTRAGLTNATATTRDELLSKIEQERRIELMTESSHRWYDLNRTGRTSYWLAPQKPTWMARDTSLPYTTNLLLANPNLHQNKGY